MDPAPAAPQSPAVANETGPGAQRLSCLLSVLQKGLGHELPNQCIAIQGLARLLEMEEGERLSAEGRDYLSRLAAGAERVHALVTALASVARLGGPLPSRVAVDLGEIIAESIAEAKQLAPGTVVEYHGTGLSLSVCVSHAALRKALVLWLRHVGAAQTPPRPLRIALATRVTGSEVEVRVSADGPAIPHERIGRLFEPFTGDGLDLFLVRQLAEDAGGQVRVEIGPDSATVFVLTCALVLSH